MRSALLALTILLFAGMAQAEKASFTVNYGDTIEIERGGIRAFVFHERGVRGIELVMLFAGLEEGVLRSRVSLRDGQSHRMALETSETTTVEFTFVRAGSAVTVSTSSRSNARLASR